jgi:hypothetical protein
VLISTREVKLVDVGRQVSVTEGEMKRWPGQGVSVNRAPAAWFCFLLFSLTKNLRNIFQIFKERPSPHPSLHLDANTVLEKLAAADNRRPTPNIYIRSADIRSAETHRRTKYCTESRFLIQRAAPSRPTHNGIAISPCTRQEVEDTKSSTSKPGGRPVSSPLVPRLRHFPPTMLSLQIQEPHGTADSRRCVLFKLPTKIRVMLFNEYFAASPANRNVATRGEPRPIKKLWRAITETMTSHSGAEMWRPSLNMSQ